MTTNRTSEAAEGMRKGATYHLMSRPVRVAIAEKFIRMQEALQRVDRADNKCEEQEAWRLVQEALAFDPLSSPE